MKRATQVIRVGRGERHFACPYCGAPQWEGQTAKVCQGCGRRWVADRRGIRFYDQGEVQLYSGRFAQRILGLLLKMRWL